VCCTYSNGPETFNLCEKDDACPMLSGYKLLKSIHTPSCSVCTGSNNKGQAETQPAHKMRVK